MEILIFVLVMSAIIFSIIEIIGFIISSYVRKNFQWLITDSDENPNLSVEGLKRFIPNGYDSELGWMRKPNTSHDEKGKIIQVPKSPKIIAYFDGEKYFAFSGICPHAKWPLELGSVKDCTRTSLFFKLKMDKAKCNAALPLLTAIQSLELTYF